MEVLATPSLPIEEDLRYRVARVRLWGRFIFDGYQFVYRHYITGTELCGPMETSVGGRIGNTDAITVTLQEDECIVDVASNEGDRRCFSVTFVSNQGRVWHTGQKDARLDASCSNKPFVRAPQQQQEVRGLSFTKNYWLEFVDVAPRIAKASYTGLFEKPETVDEMTQLVGVHCAAVAELYIKHADALCKSELHQHVIRHLVEIGDVDRLQKVVLAYCKAKRIKRIHDALTSAAFQNEEGLMLVQTAIQFEQYEMLEWLLVFAQLNPFTRKRGGGTCATTEPLALVAGVVDPGRRDQMLLLLTCVKHYTEFHECITRMASGEISVTSSNLNAIVPKITSVYNLQPILTLGIPHLTHDSFVRLLRSSCDRILSDDFLLDTKAAAFFNVVLATLKERGFISAIEYEEYKLRTSRINMESAEWVLEMKKDIQEMRWHLVQHHQHIAGLRKDVTSLRESLNRRGGFSKQVTQVLGVAARVFAGLEMIIGPLTQVVEIVVTSSHALAALLITTKPNSDEDVSVLLAARPNEILIPHAVKERLLEAGLTIAAITDFVVFLRDAVVGEHPQLVKKKKRGKLSLRDAVLKYTQ